MSFSSCKDPKGRILLLPNQRFVETKTLLEYHCQSKIRRLCLFKILLSTEKVLPKHAFRASEAHLPRVGFLLFQFARKSPCVPCIVCVGRPIRFGPFLSLSFPSPLRPRPADLLLSSHWNGSKEGKERRKKKRSFAEFGNLPTAAGFPLLSFEIWKRS